MRSRYEPIGSEQAVLLDVCYGSMVRGLLFAAISFGVFLAAAPAWAGEPAAEALADDDDVDNDDDEPGIVHRWAPVTVDDELHPAADDVSTLFFVGSVFPLGSLWLPLIFADIETPLGYMFSAPLTYLLHALPHVACAATFPCAIALTFTGVGAPALLVGIVMQLINIGSCVANLHYLTPVALLNDYNRALDDSDPDEKSVVQRQKTPGSAMVVQAY